MCTGMIPTTILPPAPCHNTWMLPNNSIAILAQKNYLHCPHDATLQWTSMPCTRRHPSDLPANETREGERSIVMRMGWKPGRCKAVCDVGTEASTCSSGTNEASDPGSVKAAAVRCAYHKRGRFVSSVCENGGKLRIGSRTAHSWLGGR